MSHNTSSIVSNSFLTYYLAGHTKVIQKHITYFYIPSTSLLHPFCTHETLVMIKFQNMNTKLEIRTLLFLSGVVLPIICSWYLASRSWQSHNSFWIAKTKCHHSINKYETFDHDQLSTTTTQERFLQDFPEILKWKSWRNFSLIRYTRWRI